jgi:hypothetical protein
LPIDGKCTQVKGVAKMPQPSFGDVHISAALTQISVAYLQTETAYVADRVFPIVPVVHQTDQYFKFSKDDYFRDEAQLRADAAESAGSGFNLTTGSYSASEWGIHKDIGDQTRRNADPAVDIDVAATKWAMQKMLIKRDVFFAAKFMTTGVWGSAGSTDVTGVASGGIPGTTSTPQWSDDANGDPFTDIEAAQTTVLQNTGYVPNVLVLSWPVYQALRKHPLIIDRIKYTMGGGALSANITPALLASAFDVEEVVIAKAVYNTAVEGLAGTYSFIVGKTALLAYRAPSPGLWTPTAGYIFAWQGFTGLNNLGVRILQIPMPWLGASMVRTDASMAFDMATVGTDMAVFFSAIVA